MKKKKIIKRLVLNKEDILNLSTTEAYHLRGGYGPDSFTDDERCVPDPYTGNGTTYITNLSCSACTLDQYCIPLTSECTMAC